MPLYWQSGEVPSVEAVCDRATAGQLVDFDHHRVVVRERWGILITYHWLPLDDALDPLVAHVVFHPAPDYPMTVAEVRQAVQRHPPAPPAIQAAIDRLQWSAE